MKKELSRSDSPGPSPFRRKFPMQIATFPGVADENEE